MLTTIVMQDTKITIFNSKGDEEVFRNGEGFKSFFKRLQKIGKQMETQQAINEAMTKAEMGKGLNKLKASLKPLKVKSRP